MMRSLTAFLMKLSENVNWRTQKHVQMISQAWFQYSHKTNKAYVHVFFSLTCLPLHLCLFPFASNYPGEKATRPDEDMWPRAERGVLLLVPPLICHEAKGRQ